ncbi:hypothetical protein DC366_13035 [Pelagivirga sediminicola]|uniref:DAGKc domain-containing protein n=1 Tax=Pelagivirga sediminicola TaxID=2170575 RepID=A0A2T7G5A9_9RHOB|nr:diacylglycerol kinase family protein [Pelagivirga sediminicola]PVA09609.1 hypothetical protein DC366_13035 [Pelagivirga sediminicola]
MSKDSQGRAAMCILLNEGSGKRETSARGRIGAALQAHGVTADIRVLAKGPDIVPAARRAVKEGYETIVAAGGDGTISAVASVLRGTDRVMGILPMGTFNYFARSLDIPDDIEGAAQLLAEGTQRPVRIATINERSFLNNASLGAYPAILKTREDVYRRWGRSRIAAYWSVLVTLVTLRRPLHLRIEADGQTVERRTPLVFAVNNAFQLDQIGLQGRQDIAEGRLALFVAPDSGRWGMLRHALSLAMGKAQNEVNFDLITGSTIRIEARHSPRDIACDGERARMKAPYILGVDEEALSVIVPQSRKEGTR